MKPIEWLLLGVLGIAGYFFWKGRSQPTTSPSCPAQTQLDGWLSDIAAGRMSTDDANKLAQSYALATPPCTDAVSAINAAIASASPHKPKSTAVTPSGVIASSPSKFTASAHPTHDIGSYSGSKGFSHVMTMDDISEGPDAFAKRAGYDSVEAFVANQNGNLTIGNAGDTIGAANFDTPSPLDPSVTLHQKVSPWSVGMTVMVYMDPGAPLVGMAPSLLLTAEPWQ